MIVAVEQASAISPVSQNVAIARSRPPEVTPDAREIAAQENDARRIAEAVSGASPAHLQGPDEQTAVAGVGTRVDVVPVPSDPEGSLQRATAEISRAYQGGEPSPAEMRAAAEAYRAEAAAQADLARRAQGEGLRTLDITV